MAKKRFVRVAYRSDSLQELFITKFKSQFKWSLTKVAVTVLELITHESGRKESFNCTILFTSDLGLCPQETSRSSILDITEKLNKIV